MFLVEKATWTELRVVYFITWYQKTLSRVSSKSVTQRWHTSLITHNNESPLIWSINNLSRDSQPRSHRIHETRHNDQGSQTKLRLSTFVNSHITISNSESTHYHSTRHPRTLILQTRVTSRTSPNTGIPIAGFCNQANIPETRGRIRGFVRGRAPLISRLSRAGGRIGQQHRRAIAAIHFHEGGMEQLVWLAARVRFPALSFGLYDRAAGDWNKYSRRWLAAPNVLLILLSGSSGVNVCSATRAVTIIDEFAVPIKCMGNTERYPTYWQSQSVGVCRDVAVCF